jgi:NAD(P)-dependent dehydrogenase (short-subunit alcohol dehydrogenase family)
MDDVLGYEGTRVVVTGSASGMGEAAARILVAVGAEVVGLDIRETEVDGVRSIVTDLKDPAAIDRAVTEIGGPVHGVFSVAGLPGPPFSDLDVMLVNFAGGRELIERLVPSMPAGAAAVCTASNAGLGWQQNLATLMPLVTSEGFAGAKAWLEANPSVFEGNAYGFSKQVINAWVAWRGAQLITSGIRLNCINPGPTTTAMMPFFEDFAGAGLIDAFIGPIARRSTPEEQAWPMVMLNSPRMSYVNAEALHTDGGFLGAMVTGQIDLSGLMPPSE